MVTCSICGAEIKDFYWTALSVKVGSSSPIPIITKAAVCEECGNHTIFISVESKGDEVTIKGYTNGQTE